MLNNARNVSLALSQFVMTMNFPQGTMRIMGKTPKQWDPKLELDVLAQQSFSGYVIETLYNGQGIDECALIFRLGQGIGATYELHASNQTVSGDASLVLIGNAFAVDAGMLDVIELSTQQVDLITAFNAKLKFSKPLLKGQFRSLVKESFDAALLPRASGDSMASDSKESLFKKFGLAGIEQAR